MLLPKLKRLVCIQLGKMIRQVQIIFRLVFNLLVKLSAIAMRKVKLEMKIRSSSLLATVDGWSEELRIH